MIEGGLGKYIKFFKSENVDQTVDNCIDEVHMEWMHESINNEWEFMNNELIMNKCECYESISMMNEFMQWMMNVVKWMKNEWMNEMRWDEEWFEFPAWEI